MGYGVTNCIALPSDGRKTISDRMRSSDDDLDIFV
jgi:hypothetical protein